ncbi:MAG: mannose-1-phosphate guanyltransferase [Clostridiales bacterium]|jgi:mannose-1-phosphate guanylyltransferase/phosphomannomutase|nr:mannose-1-phosphate guanyltransferase [Eubacteriales bacterium]MDH7565348.1 mannose-1-phosphate guanyltransferase [Clostridiales bacterium]
MKAVIMAGGEGTRLRPLTCERPKPMVPVVNKPVMEHIIELLKKYSLTDIAVTLQYMPELIKEYFNDGSDFGVHLKYFTEKKPLGTAGSVKNAEEFLDDTFLVISGDALTDIDLSKAIEFHFSKGSMATLVLKKVDVPLEYGVVVTDNEGSINRFLEKPSWGEVFSDTVNTGIYILSPEVLNYYKKNEMFDFAKDLFPILLKEKRPMYGFVTEDYWCDIGDLTAYNQAHFDILDGRVRVNIPGKEIRKGVWVDQDAELDEGALIEAPCIIGRGTRIKANAVIGSYSTIGENNIIDERSRIKRSILWKNCIIDKNVQLRGAVLCNKIHLKDNVSAFEQSVIGDDTVIKENAIIKPGIKIWPDKIIDSGVEVNSNLVWGSKFTRTIFGNRGVAGEINVDITPEYASKLGAAYGATFNGKAKIGISCDDTMAAKMLKISFTAGLLSSGIEIYDFGTMLLPVTRSAIRFYKADGGIHISTSTLDTDRLFVDFLDRNGSNINRGLERKIENAFIREDFSRCEGNCIKEIKTIPDYSKFYLRNIINNIKSKKIQYKIALNSPSGFISKTVAGLLSELGCEVEITNLKLVNTKTMRQSMTFNDVKYFTSHIKMENFDVGVSIEDTSEKMMLVDNKGRIITEDMFIALISLILFKTIEGGTVVVPISASHVVEKLADENNGKVIRTKTSVQDIMGMLLGSEIKEEMLEQFTMHFDAMAGLVKILDFMSVNGYKLSDLVDMIPDFYINKKEVECPWDAKGKVIRQIIQEADGESIETLEGVKVYQNNGWVLILPDAEQPVCKVISESYSAEFAEELSNIYVNKIREISRS